MKSTHVINLFSGLSWCKDMDGERGSLPASIISLVVAVWRGDGGSIFSDSPSFCAMSSVIQKRTTTYTQWMGIGRQQACPGVL